MIEVNHEDRPFQTSSRKGNTVTLEHLHDIPASEKLLNQRFVAKTVHGTIRTIKDDAANGAKTVLSVTKQTAQNAAESTAKGLAQGARNGAKSAAHASLDGITDDDDAALNTSKDIRKNATAAIRKAPKAVHHTRTGVVKAKKGVYRAGKTTINVAKGTVSVSGKAVSSTRRMFAGLNASQLRRKSTMKAARNGTQSAVTSSMKAAGAASRVVNAMVAKMAAIIAGAVASVPAGVIVAILAIILALVSLICSFIPFFGGAAAEESTSVTVQNVPAEYVDDVNKAGSICSEVTAPAIAAQIEAESNWNPNAKSPVGAIGIAQFMPYTWESYKVDGDGDGKMEMQNGHDEIQAQGKYMCALVDQIKALKQDGKVSGDTLQLAFAAYNAGLGAVRINSGIPPYDETRNYVKRIADLMSKYSKIEEGGIAEGGEEGTLNPPMALQGDKLKLDLGAMGLSTADTTYQAFQCTWWSALRRQQIGKPVSGHMGNGGQWDDTARSLGYSMSKSAKAGDVIVFEPGVLGADATYGHVAIVEEVRGDGGIVISESSRSWMYVAKRSISASQLKDNSSGINFIH